VRMNDHCRRLAKMRPKSAGQMVPLSLRRAGDVRARLKKRNKGFADDRH
jgi:hypothetical protein